MELEFLNIYLRFSFRIKINKNLYYFVFRDFVIFIFFLIWGERGDGDEMGCRSVGEKVKFEEKFVYFGIF